MTLPADVKSRIQNTSRDSIEQTTGDLRRYFGKNLWLANNNRYKSNTIKKISEDFSKSGSFTATKQRNLAHYIASSAQMHCIDGWSYFANAMSSLLRGDSFGAVHLAYYAELRAAMAVLAADGIGVLNNKHCVLTTSNKAERLPGNKPTHEFTWLALKEWSEKNSSGDLLSEAITPFAIPLSEWFSSLPGQYTLQPLARSWIRNWGVDLQRLADKEKGDRHARNEASYRPTPLLTGLPIATEKVVRISGKMWEMCEPVGSSKFEKLDRLLLRHSARKIYVGRNTAPATAANDDYRSFVSELVSAQNISSQQYRAQIEAFLLRDEVDLIENVVEMAKVKIDEPDHSQLGVLARAFLLLRLAAGTVTTTLAKAGVNEDELKFWKAGLLSERGFCKSDLPPEELGDLWKDIEVELSDLRLRLESDEDFTLSSIRSEFDAALFRISGFDAVPLWAIART